MILFLLLLLIQEYSLGDIQDLSLFFFGFSFDKSMIIFILESRKSKEGTEI